MAVAERIDIPTGLDTRSVVKSLKDLKRQLISTFIGQSPSELNKNVERLTKDLAKAEERTRKAKTALDDLSSGRETPKSVEKLEGKLANANARVQELQAKYAEFVGGTEKPKAVLALEKELQNAQKEMDKVTASQKRLLKEQGRILSTGLTPAGVAKAETRAKRRGLADIPSYEEYNGAFYTSEQVARLQQIEQELNKISDDYETANEKAEQLSQTIPQLLLSPETSAEAQKLAQELQHAKVEADMAEIALEQANGRSLADAAIEARRAADEEAKLNEELNSTEKAAKKAKRSLRGVFEGFQKSGERIIGMLKRMTIRLLFYQTFGKAIRSTVDYIKQAVKADDELSRSAALLRGNILTAFQQIYTILRPIILAIIKLLTWLTGIINRLLSLLTGKSISSAQAAAKSMYALGKATGSAGKEAKKTLASFDELIQIGDKDTGGSGAADGATAPIFDPNQGEIAQNIKDSIRSIAGVLVPLIAIILGAKLGLKALSLLQTLDEMRKNLDMGASAITKVAGFAILIASLISLIYFYSDAWVNGLDWGNFVGVLVSLAGVVTGIGLMFGAAAVPIALVGAGLAAIVLAVHDMIKNGPTLKNQLMAFIGLIAVVIGLIMGGHAALALVVAIIGTAILIAVNFGDQWENIMEHAGQIVDGFVKLVNDLINGDFDAAWEDAKQIVKGFANFGIDIFEGLVKAAIKAVNKIIDALNSIGFGPVPDWVPIIGGKEFYLNIPKLPTEWSLPRLAQGAVIPPNKEFMAVLGDQKHGTNIETPLETMMQAFNAALDARGNQNININFTGSLAQVARLLKPYIDYEDNRQGPRSNNGLIVGGVR